MSRFPLLADDSVSAQNDDSSDDGSKGASLGLSYGGSASSEDMQQFFQRMTASSSREARFFAQPPSPSPGIMSSNAMLRDQALEEDDYVVAARGRPSIPDHVFARAHATRDGKEGMDPGEGGHGSGHTSTCDDVSAGPLCCPGDAEGAGQGAGMDTPKTGQGWSWGGEATVWSYIQAAEGDPVWTQLREITEIAFPVALGNLSEYMPLTFGMMMVGQLPGGGAELDAMAMANSYFNITGLAVQYGLNSALRTLCPQAVGSGRSKELHGIYVQRGALISVVALLPSLTLALHSQQILVMLGQPQDLAGLAQEYCIRLQPALAGIGFMTLLQRVMQAEGHIMANFNICLIVFVVAPAIQYLLIHHLGFGLMGG